MDPCGWSRERLWARPFSHQKGCDRFWQIFGLYRLRNVSVANRSGRGRGQLSHSVDADIVWHLLGLNRKTAVSQPQTSGLWVFLRQLSAIVDSYARPDLAHLDRVENSLHGRYLLISSK